MLKPYGEDLAYIHDSAHTGLAEGAAQTLLATLRDAGIHHGLVVDLGCGSGSLARVLSNHGFAVLGFDLSESMLALARKHAPKAKFQLGSVLTMPIPECVAVTAIGEVLNYAFDERNNSEARQNLIPRGLTGFLGRKADSHE